MYPKPVQKLIDLFTKLPGIGPRQASRFVFFILKAEGNFLGDLLHALQALGENVGFCKQCFRSIEKNQEAREGCELCGSPKRDQTTIAVVEKESDMQNLERTGSFSGVYHVLGGVISPLDPDSPKKIHLKELYQRVKTNLEENKESEVILATNSTTEGDITALYIERILSPLKDTYPKLKISKLGRGLSLGSELEHVDESTLKTALMNRK